jgi:hypothetical protein
MTYSQTIDLLTDASFLNGRIIRALFARGGAALMLADGEVIRFGVEAIPIVGWFEVFPITAERSAIDVYPWEAIDVPLVVTGIAHVWREEGHTSPLAAGHLVKVHVGLKIEGPDSRCMLLLSSDSNPFVIDVVLDEQAIARILQDHILQ